MAKRKHVGMSPGMSHRWNYHTISKNEKIIGPGRVRLTHYQSKGRKVYAPSGTGMKTGSQLIWGLNGKFFTVPTRNGYKLVTYGNKKQIKYKIRGRQWK